MDTPFKDLLHTNTVPSDPECQRIRELLVGPREEAAKFTDEIARLETLLDELTAKRDRLNEFIDAHLALVSPARRLPDDLVAEIFTASLPSNRNAILSGAESPLLLCHICRAWRNLALRTPRLWASLHIVAPSDSSKVGQLNDAVKLWLSRSGVLPLSISIARSYTAGQCDVSILLKTLIHYSPRWHRMRFMLDFHSHASFEPLAALSPHDLPTLESIGVEGFHSYDADDVDWSFVSFMRTTSLHSVSLMQVVDPFRFPLSWERLRHLSLGHVGSVLVDKALDLLHCCPNLEACTLPCGDRTEGTVLVPCHMEHLRQLCVITQGETGDFFGNLVLPNLRTLEYASIHDNNPLPFTSLLHSPNSVRRLSLNMLLMTDILVNCLRLVPMLHELYIHGEPFQSTEGWTRADGEFLTHLMPEIQDSDDTICPELRSIRLVDFYALTDTTLLEFIQARSASRHGNHAPLSGVDVKFGRPIQVDIRTPLARLIGDDLKLTLRYNDDASVVYSPSERNQSHSAEWEPISEMWNTRTW
ncbi:hypothetical protein C8R44DRAFT_798749 [Mycena epipterygia]|nr:hypothetical protein C8R44DRAFT_798749 [Mycena epipterygia]